MLTAAAYDSASENRTAEVTVNNTDGSRLATLTVTQSWRNVEPGELLIQEIFLTSNLIAETGKTDSRNMEQYFILTNNTTRNWRWRSGHLRIGHHVPKLHAEATLPGTLIVATTWLPSSLCM